MIHSPRLHAVLVLATYAGLAVVMTWPLVTVLGRAAPGVGEDTPLFLWNVWWLQRVLQTGTLSLSTDLIFGPHGTSLALHGLTTLPGVLVLPISIGWSPVAALGCMTLLNCTLNGATMYRLVRGLGANSVAAWLAGVAFAYSPWATGELQNHYNLNALWPFVLLVDALLRVRREPSRWASIELGVALALVTWTDLQFLVLAVPVGLIVVAVAPPVGSARGSLVRYGAPAVLVGLLLAAPLLAPVAHDLAGRGTPRVEDALGVQYHFAGDLLGFMQPHQLRLGGRPAADENIGLATPRSATTFVQLGYVIVALAVLGLLAAARRRLYEPRFQAGLWSALALTGMALSLGPGLVMGNEVIGVGDMGVPLPPGLLAASVPVLNIERVPTRHMVSVSLALAVLAGLGVHFACARLRGRFRPGFALLAGSALVFELLPAPLPMQDLAQHPFYASIATAGPGSVIDLPLGRGTGQGMLGIYTSSLLAQAAQTAHGHPIVGGYVSRGTALSDDPATRDALLLYLGTCSRPQPAAEAARASLERASVRWIVVHRDWQRVDSTACTPPTSDIEAYLERIGLERADVDDQLTVFDLGPPKTS